MGLSKWATLARKAMRRPPRYVARRLADEVRRQGYRPWGHIRPRLLTERALVAETRSTSIDDLWERLLRLPFPISPDCASDWASRFEKKWPDAATTIVADADRILRHEFDLLGSGPVTLGDRLPWHDDFKVGKRWPVEFAADIDYNELDQNSDVKVPWELSRCQHFARLGQAYWLTGDERYAREFVDQVSDWVVRNPWTRGVNWICTMDVALRATSWIWAFYFLGRAAACQSREFRTLFLKSLFLHGEYIAGHIEQSDANGNHYLVDGVGLVFIGLLFRGAPAAAAWLDEGRRMVVDEIQTQAWPDGVDFEQSVSYHRLVLEAFLLSYLCLRIGGQHVPDEAWTRLEKMIEFVAAYTKPNGLAPLVGDADDSRIQKLGVQPQNDHRAVLSTGAVIFRRPDFKHGAGKFWDESFWLLGPSGADAFEALPAGEPPGSAAFPQGGWYVMRSGKAHLVIDSAEVGLRGLGGHGHNDILSFELFLDGMNVVTDCGAYLYTASREWRDRFRSTAFHNTVQVDNEELNRFMGPQEMWRLRDDARPVDVKWESDKFHDLFRGAHSGFRRLASAVTHVREVRFDKARQRFLFRDTLQGHDVHELVWRFHLDPDVTATVERDAVRICGTAGNVWFQLLGAPQDLRLTLESGWVSRSYGRKLESAVIALRATRQLPLEVSYGFSPVLLSPEELSSELSHAGRSA
jgi:uncharacterized heparinase superfamily protein